MAVSIFLSIPSFPGDQRLVRELGATKRCGKAGLQSLLGGPGALSNNGKENGNYYNIGFRV